MKTEPFQKKCQKAGTISQKRLKTPQYFTPFHFAFETVLSTKNKTISCHSYTTGKKYIEKLYFHFFLKVKVFCAQVSI